MPRVSDGAGPLLEIIVVDNGSIDESAAVVAHHGSRLIGLGANLGLPAATGAN